MQRAGAAQEDLCLQLPPVGEVQVPLRGVGLVVLREEEQAQRARERTSGVFEGGLGGVLLAGDAGQGLGLRVAERAEVAGSGFKLACQRREGLGFLAEPAGFVRRGLEVVLDAPVGGEFLHQCVFHSVP